MTPVTIRAATRADMPAISQVRTSVTENAMSVEQLLERGITPETVSDLIQNDGAWVAEVNGRVVAFSMAKRAEGTIFAMFVQPGWEERGLGRQLMAQAERYLFAFHDRIWLTTDVDPAVRAHGFYRGLGWRPAGLMDNGELRYEKERLAP